MYSVIGDKDNGPKRRGRGTIPSAIEAGQYSERALTKAAEGGGLVDVRTLGAAEVY